MPKNEEMCNLLTTKFKILYCIVSYLCFKHEDKINFHYYEL